MEKLVERAKKGDKEAFTELMLLFEKDLYKIAKIRLKNDDDVFDAVQETIIMAFKSLKKLKEIKYFKTWLIRILINNSNYIYKKRHKNTISFEDIENYTINNVPNTDDIETRLDIKFICDNLKYEDRVIIILYYMERFTDKEIGKILNLKENSVKTKRTRAKQKLKEIILREEDYGRIR